MKDSKFIIGAVIIASLFLLVVPKSCHAYDTIQVTTCDYVASTNNRTYVIDSLGCNDVAIHVQCSDCSLRVQDGGRGIIVYGMDGGVSGSDISDFNGRWNNGGGGIFFDKVTLVNNVVIKKLSIISGVTDTGWGTDSANSSMTAIAGKDNPYTNIKLESLTVKVWTANSHGIYFKEPGNLLAYDITIYDSVRLVGHHDQGRGTGFMVETPPSGSNDSVVLRRVRVINTPRSGIGIGRSSRSSSVYTKIEGCYVSGGENWDYASGKWKNPYLYGAANWMKHDTGVGIGDGVYIAWSGTGSGYDMDVESCYFATHVRRTRCNPGLSGCFNAPGSGWIFKVQTYGGQTGKATIKNNVLKAYCDSASGGSFGNVSIFSIDAMCTPGTGCGPPEVILRADIHNNICSTWAYTDTTNTLDNGAGAIPGPYGYYAACFTMNDGNSATMNGDSIRVWGNTFVTNDRATAFGWGLDGAVDSSWVGRTCSTNVFVRWDTLHHAGTYSPKYRTAFVQGGCQGLRIIDATYQNGASADSIYVQSGGSLNFVNNTCGTYVKKLIRGRSRKQ